ncbi:recombinase family protein [Bradyrhizobium sp. 18BD]
MAHSRMVSKGTSLTKLVRTGRALRSTSACRRMPKKYPLEHQAAAIAAYAARRHIAIVRTYSDPGRSGLRIAGCDRLQDLIRDVQLGRADFDWLLVYDITRWGRF